MPAKPTKTPTSRFRWSRAGNSSGNPALVIHFEDSGGTLGTFTKFVSNWDQGKLRASINTNKGVVIRGKVEGVQPGKIKVTMWHDHNDNHNQLDFDRVSPALLTITLTNDSSYTELPDFTTPPPPPPATPPAESPPGDFTVTTTLDPISIDLVP
jgi:hypothetical protein